MSRLYLDLFVNEKTDKHSDSEQISEGHCYLFPSLRNQGMVENGEWTGLKSGDLLFVPFPIYRFLFCVNKDRADTFIVGAVRLNKNRMWYTFDTEQILFYAIFPSILIL